MPTPTSIYIYIYTRGYKYLLWVSVQMSHYQRDLSWPSFINYYSSLLHYFLSLFPCFIFPHDIITTCMLGNHAFTLSPIMVYLPGEGQPFLSWSLLYLIIEQKVDAHMFSKYSLKVWTFNSCLFCTGHDASCSTHSNLCSHLRFWIKVVTFVHYFPLS